MNLLESDRNFLLNIFQRIPPSNVALFLRLIRLYPTNIVDDYKKRERTILAIVNEVIDTDYKDDIWPENFVDRIRCVQFFKIFRICLKHTNHMLFSLNVLLHMCKLMKVTQVSTYKSEKQILSLFFNIFHLAFKRSSSSMFSYHKSTAFFIITSHHTILTSRTNINSLQ
jgi:hypothetical protein